jgi:transport family protein 27
MAETFTSGLRSMESKHKPITILRCKLVIVGDACVGKSALTQVFSSGGSTYPKNYLMTIGAEFCVKQVPIPDTDIVVEIFIYDCAGQSIFNQLELNSKYYENTAAVMLVYSVTNKDSLQSCIKWLAAVKAATQTSSDAGLVGVVVGNKLDGRELGMGEVAQADGEGLSKSLGLKYFETSAAHNTNVDEPFKHIAMEFYKRYDNYMDARQY